MGRFVGWLRFIFLMFVGVQFVGVPAVMGDELTDILRQKGVISQEDWTRVKAKEEKKAEEVKLQKEDKFPIKVGYGKKGLTFESLDGNWKTAIQWRLQLRWSFPEDADPIGLGAYDDNAESTFQIRRARMKVGGHGYQPWLKYYFEMDWQPGIAVGASSSGASARLIDWRIMLGKYKWLSLQLGQWKVNYNRERVDSSGKQTFVERSIVNREFTIDRQVGAMLYGHLLPGTLGDSRYYVGVFSGTGRATFNDDDNMMWFGRLQWNFLGRDLEWSQSDVEYHEKPTASLAFAYANNISRCTRFSSSGCGNLSGFASPSTASDGQFRLDQVVEELAFKWRGFSLQHELHWKQVKDSNIAVGGLGRKTDLIGSYVQVGYFPHYVIPVIPKPLEAALRYAFVDPNIHATRDLRQEYTVAFNWFFSGHRNKVTLDGSHLTEQNIARPNALNEQRVRLQWDVSF